MPIPEYTGVVPNRLAQTADEFNGACDQFNPYFTSTAPQINAQIAALNALTNGTSTTSIVIGTGAKTCTTQLSLGFQKGQALIVASTANPLNQMTAICTDYVAGTGALSFNCSTFLGSGTLASWQISLAPVATVLSPLLQNIDIINGQFRVAQAGTSFVSPVSNTYDLDGWVPIYISTAAFTIAQVASTSGKFARRMTVTTADATVAAGDFCSQQTRILGYDIVKYIGNTFTVSFKAKVPVAGIHCVSLRNAAVDRTYIAEINFPVANVLQDCSVTVIGGLPTAGTWNYTNGVGLYLGFTNMCGTTFQTTANAWQVGNFHGTANQVNDMATVSNVFELEDVRINLGSVAIRSEQSYQDALRQCQSYYAVLPNSVAFSGNVTNTAAYYATYIAPVPMRAAPTLSGVNLVNSSFPASVGTLTGQADNRTFNESRGANATGVGVFGSQIIADARL